MSFMDVDDSASSGALNRARTIPSLENKDSHFERILTEMLVRPALNVSVPGQDAVTLP